MAELRHRNVIGKELHGNCVYERRKAFAHGRKLYDHIGAIVEDSILWPGAQIAADSRLNRCIVRTRRNAEGSLSDAVI